MYANTEWSTRSQRAGPSLQERKIESFIITYKLQIAYWLCFDEREIYTLIAEKCPTDFTNTRLECIWKKIKWLTSQLPKDLPGIPQMNSRIKMWFISLRGLFDSCTNYYSPSQISQHSSTQKFVSVAFKDKGENIQFLISSLSIPLHSKYHQLIKCILMKG